MSTPSQLLAVRYAAALLDLAGEQALLPAVEKDMQALNAAFAGNDQAGKLLRHPSMTRNAASAFVADLASQMKLNDLTRRFLSVVVANRRLAALPAILTAALDILAQRRGEMTAYVTSAQPVTAQQQEALAKTLASVTGKNVNLNMATDEALLGGMVIRVGTTRYDGSVRRKLDQLKTQLIEAA